MLDHYAARGNFQASTHANPNGGDRFFFVGAKSRWTETEKRIVPNFAAAAACGPDCRNPRSYKGLPIFGPLDRSIAVARAEIFY